MTMIAGIPAIRIKTLLDECARESVCATMGQICGGETTYLGSGEGEIPRDGVFGIISLASPAISSFVIGLPHQTATSLARAFVGGDIEFDSPDMGDTVGELANIMAGDLVARLDAQGITAAISVPMVARGHDIELLLPRDLPSLQQAFEAPVGTLWVKVATARPARQ